MAMSLRIAHVTPSFHPAYVYGGPTHSLYGLTRALAAHGHEVRVLTTNANGRDEVLDVATSTEVDLEHNLTVQYMPRVGHTMSPGLLAKLPEYLRWADVVHLTAVYSFPTIPTLAACRLSGRPLVWSPRGSLQRWSGTRRLGPKRVWEAVCRLGVPPDAVLHVTSESEAEQARTRMGGLRTAIVPNCLEIPEEPLHLPAPGELRLLFLGRVDPIKGLENLLDACALLQGGLPWSLKIAGSGDDAYLAALLDRASRLGIGPRVHFAGWVTSDSKPSLFANADVLVLPSHTENFGMVVAEALAHGVPVIAGRGTPWSCLEEYGCGYWVSNVPESLAHAIARMESAERSEMAARGRAWAVQELGSEVVARRMTRVYLSSFGRVEHEGIGEQPN